MVIDPWPYPPIAPPCQWKRFHWNRSNDSGAMIYPYGNILPSGPCRAASINEDDTSCKVMISDALYWLFRNASVCVCVESFVSSTNRPRPVWAVAKHQASGSDTVFIHHVYQNGIKSSRAQCLQWQLIDFFLCSDFGVLRLFDRLEHLVRCFLTCLWWRFRYQPCISA